MVIVSADVNDCTSAYPVDLPCSKAMYKPPEWQTLPGRWSSFEATLLAKMREKLATELAVAGQYPEVVGDRRLLRFLRGQRYDLDRAVDQYSKMLKWRVQNNVDFIRNDIRDNKKFKPSQFPYGELIAPWFPVLVTSPLCHDKNGRLVSYECYDFSPTEAVQELEDIDKFVRFHIYCEELRHMALDSLSNAKELSNLRERGLVAPCSEGQEDPQITVDGAKLALENEPWGEVFGMIVIRDLRGFSMEHAGPAARDLIGRVMATSNANYPENMETCYLVNAPWVFFAVFKGMKKVMSARTVAKIHVLDAANIGMLKERLGNCLPKALGGTLDPYAFEEEQFSKLLYNGELSYSETLTRESIQAEELISDVEEDSNPSRLGSNRVPIGSYSEGNLLAKVPLRPRRRMSLASVESDLSLPKTQHSIRDQLGASDDEDFMGSQVEEALQISIKRKSARRGNIDEENIEESPSNSPSPPRLGPPEGSSKLEEFLNKGLSNLRQRRALANQKSQEQLTVSWTDLGEWVPNAGSICCRLCERPFTVVRRRHHCRMCGELVCNQCSPHRVKLANGARALEILGTAGIRRSVQPPPVRVCTDCYVSLQSVKIENVTHSNQNKRPLEIHSCNGVLPRTENFTRNEGISEVLSPIQENGRSASLHSENYSNHSFFRDDVTMMDVLHTDRIRARGAWVSELLSVVFNEVAVFYTETVPLIFGEILRILLDPYKLKSSFLWQHKLIVPMTEEQTRLKSSRNIQNLEMDLESLKFSAVVGCVLILVIWLCSNF